MEFKLLNAGVVVTQHVSCSNSVVFKASVGDFNDQGKPVPLVANYKDGSTANWTMTPVQDPSEAPSDKKPVAGE